MRYEKYKNSGIEWIGKVPFDWNTIKLKRIVDIPVTDGPHETPELVDEGIPFISAEAIKNNKIDFNLRRGNITQEEHERFCKKCKPKRNDIFIIKSGATTGNAAMVETYEEFSIWSPLALIRCTQTKCDFKYIFFSIQSTYFQKQIELFWSYGTQQNIGMNVLENLYLLLPDKKLQKGISTFLEKKINRIDEIITNKQHQISLLQEKRQSIISEAVTKGLDKTAKMKDSGIEWIGKIPKNWRLIRTKFLANKIGSGVTPRGGSENYLDYGILFLRSQNIFPDGLRLDDVAYISEETHSEMSNSKVLPNDVLLNITGASLGRCYYFPEDLIEANVNQHVCIIRPNEKILSKYLYYFLTSDFGQLQIFSSEQGISREGLTFEQIKGILICVPEYTEQKKIVEYLDENAININTSIKLIQMQITKIQEYRQSLIYEVVTGKRKVN